MATLGLMVTVVPASFSSALLQPKKTTLVAQKSCRWSRHMSTMTPRHFCQLSTPKLTMPFHPPNFCKSETLSDLSSSHKWEAMPRVLKAPWLKDKLPERCYGNTFGNEFEKHLLLLCQHPLSRDFSSIHFPQPTFAAYFSAPSAPIFFHFSPSLTHCLSQSVSQWAAPMKRWSTFESAASLKSGHHFLSLSHFCPLFSPLICSSLNSKSALPPSPPALLLLYINILPSFVA